MHKLQVSDAATARQVEAAGGRLIADYGGYQLHETPHLTSQMLAKTNTTNCVIVTIPFFSMPDISIPQAGSQSVAKNVGTFTGKHLHLVQFAGPVQAKWREELLAMGVQIVSYIPENAYLIYGDAKSLARVQQLAGIAPQVQWEGANLDDYKIHPKARTVDTFGQPRGLAPIFSIFNWWPMMPRIPIRCGYLTNSAGTFKRQSRVLGYLNVVVRLDAKQLARIAAQSDVVAILPYFLAQGTGTSGRTRSSWAILIGAESRAARVIWRGWRARVSPRRSSRRRVLRWTSPTAELMTAQPRQTILASIWAAI